ncbi:anaphase-promoting complex subunit 2 [Podarcis lilfordi]|uniref:Anaphase-promoting complex subunit 2 n=1 Tax=Podarcis lilfordi TaxID=74358 RepID=A0AA35KZY2_9SAUR|nr:anaphase-promoting complex subunit 2 [Podarcis lilfordi]
MELSAAWSALSTGLVPPEALGMEAPPRYDSPLDLRPAWAALRHQGLQGALEDWFLEVLQTDLQSRLGPEFWRRAAPAPGEPQHAHSLLEAFRWLEERLAPYLRGAALLEEWVPEAVPGTGATGRLRGNLDALLRAVVFLAPPGAFQEALGDLYGRSFRVYMAGNVAPAGSGEEEGTVERFEELNGVLHRLRLLERISTPAVTDILHRMIAERLEGTCRGEFERSFLPDFQEWLERVIGWVGWVFRREGGAEAAPLRRWRCHVQRFFYRLYTAMRIEELFGIIRDFPDSKPAIEDLKFCLERTNQRQHLLTSLKSALEMRLLHPGVNTSDIITLYICAIKALRQLDPSMVILQVAGEPIRKYLRTREDTVRQIVAGLTGEGSGDLAHELSRADPVALDNGQESDEEAGAQPEDWVPDPVDAHPAGKPAAKRRSADIITLLVSIYGSKDLFINEYRTLLADRLLHQLNYSAEREIRNVELLKLRFGETQMLYCEVMLKDMADSRRINAHIRDEEQKLPEGQRPPFRLAAAIISSEFWPPLKEEKLELPAEIKAAMEDYARKYEKLKAMRTLSWKHHLGAVCLEVELADRTLSLSVTPAQAAIILHFQDKGTWTLEELSAALHCPPALLRRKLALWLQQGVLREEAPGTFAVVEEAPKEAPEKVVLVESDEEGDSAMASQADQKEGELQVFWTYIQAMLTNLESLPLERIHSMLKIFVMTGPMVSEIDLRELQIFLQKKVQDEQLVYCGGVYRLPKAGN